MQLGWCMQLNPYLNLKKGYASFASKVASLLGEGLEFEDGVSPLSGDDIVNLQDKKSDCLTC